MRLLPMVAAALLGHATTHAQNATVTVIHGIPGLASPVDVFANNTKLFSFDFNQSRTLSLPPATYGLEVKLNGQTVLSGSAMVAAGRNYSVIAHQQASSGIRLSVFENDLTPLQQGESRLAVRHTAKAPAVDVGLDQGSTRIATIRNLANPNEATADVTSGAYSASLFAAGTTNRAFGPVDLKLQPGTGYAVFAIGDLTGNSFTLFVHTFTVPVKAAVTVIHGIPGLPQPVEVFANSARLFSFDFDASRTLALDPGTYNLEVKLGGQTVLSGAAKVESGGNYTVIAHLRETSGNQLSVFVNDNSPIDTGKARLAVRHTAKAPAVDVALDQFNRRVGLIPNLRNPGEASVEVPAGPFDASLFAAGTSNRAFGPVPLRLAAGTGYAVFAIGDIGNTSFRLFVQTYGVAQLSPIRTEIRGAACAGRMWISNPSPSFDESFEVSIFAATPNDAALLAIGLAQGNVPLPANCTLYVRPDVLVPILTDLAGRAAISVSIPKALGGALPPVYLQWGFPATPHGSELRTTDYLIIRQ